jgi:hypothetical protein
MGFLPQSVCVEFMGLASPPVKKGAVILSAVILAPVLLVGLVALAASDWRAVGATAGGDQVLVSSISTRKNGLRTAWVRVEYKEPIQIAQGGPFVELRARVRFNCDTGSSVANAEWFYSRDHGGKLVVAKKARHDDEFGQAGEGNFGEMARDFVCKQK